MNKFFKSYLFLVSILFIISSCRDVMKVKSSVRKTQTQMRVVDRTISQLKKGVGYDDSEKENTDVNEVDSTLYLSMKQKNMLNNYSSVFDFLNGNDPQIKSDNFTWDSVQKGYYFKDKSYKTIKPKNEVFGWHPYWMGSKWKNYPFELLSTISYFSYKIDPLTGKYTDENEAQMEEWKTTAMVASAKANNTRVLLTVSCHGYENNTEFLDNPDRWDVLIKTTSNLLLNREDSIQGDGIDLNFESLPYFKREKFNRFVGKFKKHLEDEFDKKDKEFFLSITLPAFNSKDNFDVKELQKHADLLIIMGYNYHIGGEAQGAVAPLQSSENSSLSLSSTVQYYLEQGIDPSKTILALPYYGSIWKGKLKQSGNTVINTSTYEKPLTYSEIRKKYIDNDKLKIAPFRDEKSMTNYYSLNFEDNTTQEVWFDDDYTLRKKYDFALSNKLKGIGVWALGYDNGYDDLWNVIEDKFATDKKLIVNPIAESEGYPIRFSKYLLNYKSIFIIAAIFFLMTVILAFLVLLFDWNVRDSIIRNQLYLLLFVAIVFVLLIPITIVIFHMFNKILPINNLFIKSQWIYYISFFVGVITMFFGYRLKIKPIKRP
jgi:spore germination protein YaaH